MKKILTYGWLGLLSLTTACGSSEDTAQQQLPLVNSVAELVTHQATAIPLFAPATYWVKGKVAGKLFLFGKGYLKVADLADDNQRIFVITDISRPVGAVVTLRVEPKEIVEINDESYQAYIEQ